MTQDKNASADAKGGMSVPATIALALVTFVVGGGLTYFLYGPDGSLNSAGQDAPAARTETAAAANPTTTGPATTSPASAEDDSAVVARVGGTTITEADLEVGAESMSEQLAGIPPEGLRTAVIQSMIDVRIMALAAEKAGLADTPKFNRLMSNLHDRVLRSEYFQAEILPQVTDESVRARYDEEVAKLPPTEEVEASHILLETEDEAKGVITEIEGGAVFADIAKEKSKDPGSGPRGGELGFFTKERMVPEFAEAAFAMQPGDVSKEPVQSQFGWHVIHVTDRRQQPPPAYEQVQAQVRDLVLQDKMIATIEKLRSETEIEILVPMEPDAPEGPAEAPAASEGAAPAPAQ